MTIEWIAKVERTVEDGYTVTKVVKEYVAGGRSLVEYVASDGKRSALEIAEEHAQRLNEGHARAVSQVNHP